MQDEVELWCRLQEKERKTGYTVIDNAPACIASIYNTA